MRLPRDNRIFIGLGSNLGNTRQNLAQAVSLIEDKLGVTAVCSAVYRSEPVELIDQPWFLNQVIYFSLEDDKIRPLVILQVLKTIEQLLGRLPNIRYGPRLIDLDLLFFKDWVFESRQLVVPHPKLSERSFVLMPLLELDPYLIHPRLQLNISQISTANLNRLSACQRL